MEMFLTIEKSLVQVSLPKYFSLYMHVAHLPGQSITILNVFISNSVRFDSRVVVFFY